MGIGENRFVKLFSRSAILSVGAVIVSLSLFMFKIIFYQKSEPVQYSGFLVANLTYLFYQIIGYLNIGNPLSNDVNQYKNDVKNRSNIEYITNATGVVFLFSLISNVMMVINLFLINVNWIIILMFCGVMLIENLNLIIIVIFRGMEKIVTSALLHSVKGLVRPLLLFAFSFAFTLTTETITLTVIIAEVVALFISLIFFSILYFKEKVDFKNIRLNKEIFKTYTFQGLLLVVITLCVQGFRSFTYILLDSKISDDILGFFDVPLTFLLFALTFFINIGLMLAVSNEEFKDKSNFLKKVILRLFLVCVLLVIIYEIVAYFIVLDDTVLELFFDLDGSILAKGIMIILPSFPFYVLFYVIIGYQQGSRKYLGMALASFSALVICMVPNVLLILNLGLDGALWSNLIFSFFLALFSILVVYFDKIDETLERLVEKIKLKFSKESKNEEEISPEEGISIDEKIATIVE